MREDDATTDELLSAVGKMFAKLVRSDAFGHTDSASALAQLTETGAAALAWSASACGASTTTASTSSASICSSASSAGTVRVSGSRPA